MAVTAALQHVGRTSVPVVSVDGIGSQCDAITALAAGLMPFPAAVNNYPGLRRIINEDDGESFAYVVKLLEDAAPYLAGAFDLDGFDMVEASFSMVTTPADALNAAQRAPHFDSVDPDLYAVLHYVTPCAGTAFYRQRASGVEAVTPQNVDSYVAIARVARFPSGYIIGDTDQYERIGAVEGLAGRLVAYPARLLHSGIIPADFKPSADPASGRLTTNIFIRARR